VIDGPGTNGLPVEAFLAGYPDGIQDAANTLRSIVRRAVPDAIERVRPGWRLVGYDIPVGKRTTYFAFVIPESVHVHLGFEHGIFMADPERLIFVRHRPYADYLGLYRRADLFLDTWPYNAHTTASDALWAGVPVLTCSGESFAARVAGSLLQAVGLPELITHKIEDYEALALSLAHDPIRLAELRYRLSKNRMTYPLFDCRRFCRHIEASFEVMWARHERGEKPGWFVINTIDLDSSGQ
jgi:hypothetical protein